jgi:hypothetical protein
MATTPGIPLADLLNQRLPSAERAMNDPKAIAEAAAEFESLFVNEMLKVMRRTIPKNPDASMATEMFTGMLDGEVAKATSGAQSGLGIARLIQNEMMDSIGVPRDLTRLVLDGQWVRPVGGKMGRLEKGQEFGASREGIRPEDCGDGHCGVDLGRGVGTPVQAASIGIVTRIERDKGSKAGLWVELEHRNGQITSRYMHLESIESGLKVGDRVQTGQQIGEVGNTGTASHGAHLHFELFENTNDHGRKYLNPEDVFKFWGGPIRWANFKNEHADKISPQVEEGIDDAVGVRDSHRFNGPNKAFGLAYVERYKLEQSSGEQ